VPQPAALDRVAQLAFELEPHGHAARSVDTHQQVDGRTGPFHPVMFNHQNRTTRLSRRSGPEFTVLTTRCCTLRGTHASAFGASHPKAWGLMAKKPERRKTIRKQTARKTPRVPSRNAAPKHKPTPGLYRRCAEGRRHQMRCAHASPSASLRWIVDLTFRGG